MCKFRLKYGLPQRAALYSLLSLGLLISVQLSAQVSSDKSWFESTYNYGCQGLTVIITHTRTGAGALFYGFEGSKTDPIGGTNFEGSFTEGTSESYTYTDPGTYYIVVVDQSGSGSDADRTDILEVTVVPDQPPAITGRGCSSNTIELTFNKSNDPYDSYFIQFGDGNSITTDGNAPLFYNYPSEGTYTINMQGRFNEGHHFSCSTYEINFTAFDQVTVPQLTAIEVQSETSISLAYTPLLEELNYLLQIDRGAGFEDLQPLSPSTNPESVVLDNPSFNTTTNYYGFRIIAEDQCQTSNATSEAGYSIAFSISRESVDQTFDLLMDWSTGAQNFNTINLLKDANNFQTFNTSSATNEPFSFAECTALGTFYMQTNINGITSVSISQSAFTASPAALPALTEPQVEIRGSVIELEFPPSHFPLGEYIVYRKDTGLDFQEVFRTASVNYTDTTIPSGTSEVCYRIAYVDECGNQSEVSTESCLVLSTSLGVPNAFSPNGDQINDEFKISEGIYANFKMAIFNRWGTLVYYSTDPAKGWNGDYEGQPARSGTYLYQISFQNADNLLITKSGSFVLIR
jgi:gliding motility-associated-like protein